MENKKPSNEIVARISNYYLKIPGSFPYAVCNLARGRSDAHVELNVAPLHRLAGTLIAFEAGGKITKFDGSDAGIFDDEIVITNGLIHNQLLEILNRK